MNMSAETANILDFSMCKEHHSVENCMIVPNIKFEQHIIMIDLFANVHPLRTK